MEEEKTILPMNWTLRDFEERAELLGETLDEDVIVYNIPDIRGGIAFGNLNDGFSTSWQENYINVLVEHDMSVEINVPESANSGNANYVFWRNDNDLEISEFGISSKENDTIQIKNRQLDSSLCSLASEIHKKMNYNLNANTVNESIYQLEDDKAKEAAGAASNTDPHQHTFNLSEYFGENSFFSRYSYLDKEEISYYIKFTGDWTKIAQSLNPSNTNPLGLIALAHGGAVSCTITERIFRIPSKLQEMFRENQFFIMYEVFNRVYPENIQRYNVPAANQEVEFNLTLTQVDWENSFQALILTHVSSVVSSLVSTVGELAKYTSSNYIKFVPNNLLRFVDTLEIYLFSTLIEDLTSNEESLNYFRKNLEYSIISEDISQACIYIPKNKILEIAPDGFEELRFRFVFKMKAADNGDTQGYSFASDGSDFKIFVVGLNNYKLINGKICNKNSV